MNQTEKKPHDKLEMKDENPLNQIQVFQTEAWIPRLKENAYYAIKKYGSCTQAILSAFMQEFKINNTALLKSTGALHGGLLCSYTCGIHIAGMMILGLLMGREKIEDGHDALFPIVFPAQALMKRLNLKLGSHSCKDLTGVDFTDLEKAVEFMSSEEHKKCLHRVATGAEEIALFISEANKRGELYLF